MNWLYLLTCTRWFNYPVEGQYQRSFEVKVIEVCQLTNELVMSIDMYYIVKFPVEGQYQRFFEVKVIEVCMLTKNYLLT